MGNPIAAAFRWRPQFVTAEWAVCDLRRDSADLLAALSTLAEVNAEIEGRDNNWSDEQDGKRVAGS